eukprot:6447784-Pyramimonas_sp.AAC.1
MISAAVARRRCPRLTLAVVERWLSRALAEPSNPMMTAGPCRWRAHSIPSSACRCPSSDTPGRRPGRRWKRVAPRRRATEQAEFWRGASLT